MLHKILTAVTALAVVASLLAGAAGQAAAVTGYDSAYFGESAFLTLGPGQSGQFAVGFNNTGSTGWLTGSASQVDLAICLPDKVTCNVTSPNAAFASGWLSSTAYATTSTTYVGPGQTGYFVYNVSVPAATAPGTYRFNGDLALHGTASMIHPQGYYQDVQVPNVGAPAKLACTANPTTIEKGSSTTSTITVTVQDSLGNTVVSDSARNITLSQAGGTGSALNGGAADAAATVADASGVSTFTLSAKNATATGTDQLSASATNLTGCVVNVTIAAAGAPASLKTTLGQTAFPAGAATTTSVNVTLKDAAGVTTTATANTTVTLTVSDTTICNFGGASSTTALITTGATGTADSVPVSTKTLNVTGLPGTCTVTASATGLTSGSATETTAASGPAAQLAVTSNTCNPAAINTNCTKTVQIQDAAGNPVFTAAGTSVAETSDCIAASLTTNSPQLADATATATFTEQSTRAQSCTATFTATVGPTTMTTTAPLSFTGFGTAAKISSSKGFVPNPIPANGVSTSSITYCVRDAAGNVVTTNSGDSVSLIRTADVDGTNTTVISTNPTTTSSGCATFTVQSTTTPGTDSYHAFDTTLNFTSTPDNNIIVTP